MITALAVATLSVAAGLAPADTPIEPIEESVITLMVASGLGDEVCALVGLAYPALVVAIGDAEVAEDMLIGYSIMAFEDGWNEDHIPGEPAGRMTLEAQEAWSDFMLDCAQGTR